MKDKTQNIFLFFQKPSQNPITEKSQKKFLLFLNNTFFFKKEKNFEKMVPAGIEPATLAFLFSISTMHYRLCYGAFQIY